MGAVCCCLGSDSSEEDSINSASSLIVHHDGMSPSYGSTQRKPMTPGRDIDAADPSGAHHCAFCQRLIIDIQDESASTYSFDFSNSDDTYDTMRDCGLFRRLAEDISIPVLDSSAVIHALVSCNEQRDTWDITLVLKYTSESQVQYGRNYFFYIYTRQGDPAHKVIPRLVPNLEPETKASFRTAREWLSDCQENHPGCRHQTDQTRPTRLLEIPTGPEGTRTLRLVNAESEHSYVALSYCWGGDQPCKLTKARLREGGIFRTVDLPRTILDAVEVARNLGIAHIWIDALCIVQDDPESMWSELEKMPAIYSNAAVTISAASASTCHEGFLKAREAVDFNKVSFQLRLRTPSGEEGHIFLAPWKKSRELEGVEKEPINDRAWTLQEQVVSPRVLYYSFQQLHWICRGGIRADGGFCPTDRDTPWKGGAIYRIFALSQTTDDMVDPSISQRLAQLDEHASWRRNWSRLLQDYQARRLTNRDDRLVAISAVGALFARYMGTGFVAGLFERDLAIDLLWSRRADDGSGSGSEQAQAQAQPRPATYRAPSWSWASIDSNTQNTIATKEILAPDAVTMEVLPWPDQQPPTPQARIGRVPLELRICAWITKARVRSEGPKRELKGQQWHLPLDSITYSLDAIDPDLDMALGVDVELIEIYWYPPSPRQRNRGLPMDKVAGLIALRGEEDGQQRYRRIGYFEMEVSSLYEKAVQRGGTVTRQRQPRRQMVHDAVQSQRSAICLV